MKIFEKGYNNKETGRVYIGLHSTHHSLDRVNSRGIYNKDLEKLVGSVSEEVLDILVDTKFAIYDEDLEQILVLKNLSKVISDDGTVLENKNTDADFLLITAIVRTDERYFGIDNINVYNKTRGQWSYGIEKGKNDRNFYTDIYKFYDYLDDNNLIKITPEIVRQSKKEPF